jgi:cytochrome P450
MGWGWILSFLQPGPSHTNQRKMLRRAIGSQTIESHNNIIDVTVQKFVLELSTFQGNPNNTIQRYVVHFVSIYVILRYCFLYGLPVPLAR